jgi:deoxyribose-phosphate aldolase
MESLESLEYHLLHPQVTDNQIDQAACMAVALGLGGLCVPPYWVKKASRQTKGSITRLSTVIG